MSNTSDFTKQLPGISECRQIFKAVAMLDAILMPEWEYRYYSYNAQWDANEQMASMRDGEGDHYFALFDSSNRLIIKGYDKAYASLHKDQLDDVLERVPEVFKTTFLNEPAFMMDQTTFCVWNDKEKNEWTSSQKIADENYPLLQVLVGGAAYYHAWAQEYYEVELELEPIQHVFDMKPLDEQLLQALNPEIELDELEEDIAEIGYPA
ncbi:hypothetical protein M3629_11900 [Paenibacillus polysaccharolyticus]|uniref:hypothetical protein n=1 Tax=Paenibacillus polysaccharolyticus TaxID=582692 RepID=UPI00203BC706|nr:hypothetical protein [Paenibacillus polysaccharolyticus]MCM3133502.1 hypothetical protein [Paenibacillus polysaccharolyticus]